MKEIKIELLKDTDPASKPPICPDTMRHIKEAISDIRGLMAGQEVVISFEEKETAQDEIPKTMLIINNQTLEELVPLPDPSKYCGFACSGCSQGEEKNSRCQRIYSEIPESVLRLAVKKAVEKL